MLGGERRWWPDAGRVSAAVCACRCRLMVVARPGRVLRCWPRMRVWGSVVVARGRWCAGLRAGLAVAARRRPHGVPRTTQPGWRRPVLIAPVLLDGGSREGGRLPAREEPAEGGGDEGESDEDGGQFDH